jgi:MFS family permease
MPSFRVQGIRLISTSALTNLSDGILRLALPLMAIDAGASAFQVSVIVAAALSPWLVGSLFAGAIIDLTRRSLLVRLANCLRGLVLIGLALVLLLWQQSASFAAVLAIGIVCGLAEVFSDLSSQSAVPELVPDADLESLYGRVSVVQNTSNTLLGPALGGFLYQLSPGLLIAAVALSYLLSALAFPATPLIASQERWRPQTLLAQVGAGLATISRDSWLRRAVLAVGAMNFASGASMGVLVLYSLAPTGLGLTSAQYGLLLGASGVGAIVGGLLVRRATDRFGSRLCLFLGASALVTNISAPSLSGNAIVVATIMFAASALGMLFGVQVIAARQRRVDQELRGRVNAAFQLVGLGSSPLGAITGGAAVSLVGQRPIFVLFGAAAAAVVLLARPWQIEEPAEQLRGN